ncbi:endonuclease/exonuclease/phosphatase family protein [Flavobacterium gawalongense]|uniref:Endonuclease/exonuclease/phosphatase family protein n=1 Tax=Flavobacterium gawalongense TaxID=2594432 RepID=A0A553BZ25_9FLAO|nr:endonuclease/exonuclease/phosphatase family protein [Flavobacterium gawalongense]TRX04641.1 endonuclease/exonuclease/phosphatase family protein [Flavobacterium gawalongense]TRX10528.1 endonuclease/exonuclease/phosphatase family protein [Flavobacterium gawalongense]TRX13571.1 endonuclease/exonuclease/phosphatase family protein [Flavobacterium gawalongense]TRX15497.1 endonuclease/exonuclease/phosphatase family protein [Flavobacterium gawalongense]TRX31336.1 endonuclease/exonuclease/phosphatas
MKNLSWFNKVMFVLNIALAVMTFIAYVLPFLAPKSFPLLSVLTLFMPLFFIINGLFFAYWAIQFKKRMIVSGLVLLIGITFINKFYKFSSVELPKAENDFTIMSYNVHLFNVFKWIDRDDVPSEILTFINDKNPDILCIQEYSSSANIDLKVYPHRYIFTDGNNIKSGQAIFSKFPIIDQGNVIFPNSTNNVVFADIKKGKDVIRVYNMHLQSLKISPDVNEIDENIEAINQDKSQMMFKRISIAFKQQQEQAEIFMEHKKDCKYPIIICGDMNNSAFSYVYRSIKGKLKDSFEEAGKGFGATYKFRYYPARIDYIFADEKMKVKKFESFPEFINSDHFPIMARLSFE